LVTLVNSNWRLTFHWFHPPAYADQPANVQVWWGYGLLVDCIGNFVPKTLLACSGREILVELFSHLALQDDLEALLGSANCIPCLLPFATSQFMPRAPGDRPAVLPTGTTHLALIGQYCEIPHDVVYTVEYSIHSARLAVTGLLGLKDEMPPTYQGLEHPNAMMEALKMILR
jgi:oleate hydratase